MALVEAIAKENPAFICFTGDVVYNGDDVNDWKVWDHETSVWRDEHIPVYPALGNHDLHGDVNDRAGQLLSTISRPKGQPLLLGTRWQQLGSGAG